MLVIYRVRVPPRREGSHFFYELEKKKKKLRRSDEMSTDYNNSRLWVEKFEDGTTLGLSSHQNWQFFVLFARVQI